MTYAKIYAPTIALSHTSAALVWMACSLRLQSAGTCLRSTCTEERGSGVAPADHVHITHIPSNSNFNCKVSIACQLSHATAHKCASENAQPSRAAAHQPLWQLGIVDIQWQLFVGIRPVVASAHKFGGERRHGCCDAGGWAGRQVGKRRRRRRRVGASERAGQSDHPISTYVCPSCCRGHGQSRDGRGSAGHGRSSATAPGAC